MAALTARGVEAIRPQDRVRRYADGGGLALEVRPTGVRLWVLRYRYGGRERLISLGPYPEVSLREARLARDEARRLLRDGIDPSAYRQAQRAAQAGGDTLEAVAREWWDQWRRDKAPSHHSRVWRALERDVIPHIGRSPIDTLGPLDVLGVLRRVEGRGAVDTAHRIRHILGMVMRYAVATGRLQRDITADLRGALRPVVGGHMGAITDPEAWGALLRAIDGYQGYAVTAWALRLAPLVAVRPGELRGARWGEIDLESATWTIPAGRMKLRKDHIVPLSRQAVEILREVQMLTGHGELVFPGARSASRPISDNTLTAALRRLGYTAGQMTAHGFRASFRTLGAEVLGFREDLMEHQLAHAVRDPLGRAYNRTQFLTERREMMQRWADWCNEMRGVKLGYASSVTERRPAP